MQPLGLEATAKLPATIATTIGVTIVIVVTDAYFGLSVVTLLAAAIFAVPMAMRVWEKELPNFEAIYRWFPRGFLKFSVLLIVGILLSKIVLGSSPTPDEV